MSDSLTTEGRLAYLLGQRESVAARLEYAQKEFRAARTARAKLETEAARIEDEIDLILQGQLLLGDTPPSTTGCHMSGEIREFGE